MRVDAMLCNHAEAVNNLLYVSGGGINITSFPPGLPAPYPVAVALAIQITVPWTQTNQQYKVSIDLIGEDGKPVTISSPAGIEEPFRFEMAFNVGRPAGLLPGDEQSVALAANLGGLPMPAAGKYEFVINVDGNPERHLPLRLQPQQGAQMSFG